MIPKQAAASIIRVNPDDGAATVRKMNQDRARRETHFAKTRSACVTATWEIPTEALTVVASPPETLSQRNIEAVTGIPPRVYLEEVRSPGFPLPVVRLGKLRIVDRSAFLDYLRTRAATISNDEPDGRDVDSVLAEIGLDSMVHASTTWKNRRKRSPSSA